MSEDVSNTATVHDLHLGGAVYSLRLEGDSIIEVILPLSMYDYQEDTTPLIVKLFPCGGSNEPLELKVLSTEDHLANAYFDLGDEILVQACAYRSEFYRKHRFTPNSEYKHHRGIARCRVMDLFNDVECDLNPAYRRISRDLYSIVKDNIDSRNPSKEGCEVTKAILELTKTERIPLHAAMDIATVSGVRSSIAEYKASPRQHYMDFFKICRDLEGKYWLNVALNQSVKSN